MDTATIETERLTLRPLLPEDAAALFELYADPEALRFMPETAHENADETRNALERMMAGETARYWAICEKGAEAAFGYCGFLNVEADGKAGAGYALQRSMWRQGFGTEALRAITDHGFRELGIERIELWILRGNLGSQGVARNVGYEKRATFFQKYAHEDEAHSTFVLGLYRDDWLAGRAGDVAETRPEPMAVLEPVLTVPDVGEALIYYRDRLGFRIGFRFGDPPSHGGVSLGDWSFQGATIQLDQAASDISSALSGWLYLNVGADIDALHGDMMKRGANVLDKPENKPWGRREFNVEDLNGYRLRFGAIE